MARISGKHLEENRSAWRILVEDSPIFETADGFSRILL
jgi:hypothetical protein